MSQTKLTAALSETIASVALQEGRKRNLAPLVVAVLDAGGHAARFS